MASLDPLGSATMIDGNVKSISIRLHKTIPLRCTRWWKPGFTCDTDWVRQHTHAWGSSFLLSWSVSPVKTLLRCGCLGRVHHKVYHSPWSSPRKGLHKVWEQKGNWTRPTENAACMRRVWYPFMPLKSNRHGITCKLHSRNIGFSHHCPTGAQGC